MDKDISQFSESLASQVQKSGLKKIAVLDLTDLQGNTPPLGTFLAEETTVNLVIAAKSFAVVDRAHLKVILDEHKLTVSGLIQPENAKKLGQFSGVDGIVLGTMAPLKNSIKITAKLISTETAEIVGAAKGQISRSPEIDQMLEDHKPPPSDTNQAPKTAISATQAARGPDAESGSVDSGTERNTVKSLGNLRIELEPLRIVNGSQILLTMSLKNQNPKNSIRVGPTEEGNHLNARIFDSAHAEFLDMPSGMSGMQPAIFTTYHYAGDVPAPRTEIKPNESISVTVKFQSPNGGFPTKGTCELQMELLVQTGSSRDAASIRTENLITKIEAN